MSAARAQTPVCEVIRATLMKNHSLGGLTTGPASLEAQVWVQGVRRPGFPRGLSPDLVDGVFSLSLYFTFPLHVCTHISCSYKEVI